MSLPLGDPGSHLIHGSLGPPESIFQTAPESFQPYLQGSHFWHIELVSSCMKTLDHGIWNFCISLPTKIRLYNVYIIPVIMYDSDV